MNNEDTHDEGCNASTAASTESMVPNPPNAIRTTIKNLSSGPLVYLVSSGPIASTSQIPLSATQAMPPIKMTSKDFTPKTKSEKALFAALQDSELREEDLKRHVI
jgi:hypothetical protein